MAVQDTQLPDIFITGVMKGGTTVLHDYICTHPKVEPGSEKEIHYFSLHYDKGPEWYAGHFRSVSPECRTIDASPTYFDATNTSQIPRLIRAYTEDPRVILITRDPIKRAISHFVHMKKYNHPDQLGEMSADEFFAPDLQRAMAQTDLHGMLLHHVLNFSFYTRKYITYKNEFSDTQFLALDNDELRSRPIETMQRVFAFLDLDYVGDSSFGEVRYSNQSGIGQISRETFDRLAELFYPDYQHFCQRTGISFKPAVYQDAKAAA